MIADLKPYPDYKDSGLPWLGHVPATWRVVRNGSLFGQRNQTGFSELPILEVSLKTGVRVRNFETSKRKQIMADLGKYKRAGKGDIAYNMMRMWQGAVGVSPADGLVSPAYVVARPYENVDPHFFATLFKTDGFMSEIDNCSRGIVKDRNRLYWDQFKQMLVPCPPLDEQAAIMRFLDWANSRFERTIRAKRKVITLLNEQKQAIIHRAVTRGLEQHVPLKHSKSPWFSEIPAQWKVVTLRRVIKSAIDGPHFSPSYQESGVPFLSARNVKIDRWSLENAKFISNADYSEFSRRVLPVVDDVLYTKGGTTGIARVVDLNFPFQVWVHIAVLKIKKHRIAPKFLAYCLNSPRCYVQSQLFTRGATNQDLGLGRMKEIELPLPPALDEQEAIVAALDVQTSFFSIAISRLEREIELLREYRTRLVADVVTGKLDVRVAAEDLPASLVDDEEYLINEDVDMLHNAEDTEFEDN